MSNKIHTFGESLAFSHAASDLPIWETVYRQFFPDFLAMHDHRQDGYHQRQGIDRSIILKSSKQILIDEKVRDKNYDDIFLEFISNDRTKALGWVCKPLAADFIAYAILPRGKVYLLPVLSLQSAFVLYGEAWKAEYTVRSAQNEGYKTWGVCVPACVVFKAMAYVQVANFEPIA